MADIDPQLQLLRRQCLQLFEPDFLAWPHSQLLARTDAQNWLAKHMFDEERNARLPPKAYLLRVLKLLIARNEKTSRNALQDGVAPTLKARLEALTTHDLSTDYDAMKERAYVTFTCLPASGYQDEGGAGEPTVTLLEQRQLVVGSRITGFRTWEGALHLGTYLLTNEGSDLIKGKAVLELGAGTGFLSIQCAKHLGARHVTTTDGDEGVVDSLRENLALNGLNDERIAIARKLWWGEELKGSWVERDCEDFPYDVVLGADVTYDKTAILALVVTLEKLFELRPKLLVIIGGVIRNAETFQVFLDECARRSFTIKEVPFGAKSMREQKALFYAAAMPLKILKITGPISKGV
ncbi:S-adenosyl-L-methionine-dependent methyltransferase [Xylariaceae sp. FL1272]|nr:S-adenosyl-L-methionine-dependent methyltransferase [Xylariaceae sp. FL1272]